MSNLLFTALIIALLYYFFFYLPSQKKLNANLPFQHQQATQTETLSEEKATQTNLAVENKAMQTEKEQEQPVVVYQDFVAPHHSVPYSQALAIAESDQYQLGLLLQELGYTSLAPIIDISELKKAIQSFTIDKEKYHEQLESQLTAYTNLENKLERVRNLLATQEIKKLQSLFKKGKI